jgi:hypothetical protein
MTPTDYEIAKLMALALFIFALGCGPLYLAERKRQQQDNDQ